MADSRSTLLEAAASEFAKYGPKGTRIQDVVKAAGVNERMIYHHFGSKAGLYRAVMEEERARLGATWGATLERAATLTPLAGMRLALQGFFDALLARPQAAALLILEGLSDAPLAVPAGVDGPPKQVRTLYEQGQAEGVFASNVPFEVVYPVAVSTLLAMSVFGSRLTELTGVGLDADPIRRRDQVVTQVLNGLTG